ncbi:Crp/Fnr family transcriptional regulator [Colwellia sp. D2M02]|uniref:Crp/Fnr family transcriptional regulator n=1 Tax=Colwellia sp. D2M02 TaxID=2841562 RepID=UPI001C09B115|nr:Crp/Fnr family transcriptional regulator [Colwellia sp. D2M02]MBU2894590.1 Crp/Fnr family transcriptional regulator [Colwellia sp. D2M02]
MSSAYQHLQTTLNQYYALSDKAWQAYLACCSIKEIAKGEVLYSLGERPKSFMFIHQGLMRAYVIDDDGHEYNKNFFAEGRFPGCMSALLNGEPTTIAIEAVERCQVVEINHQQFRAALFNDSDLMAFHIHYLEKHWLLEKEPKEISYLQYEAKARYLKFLANYHTLLPRLPQYHIASYLGITATQLSRIKKSLSTASLT